MNLEKQNENPYASSQIDQIPSNRLRAVLERFAAVLLYIAGWFCIGVAFVVTLKDNLGELSMSKPDAELSTVDSFLRFCLHYWFTAFIQFSPPICFAIWLALRRSGIRKTRWALLAIGLAFSPIQLVIAWLVLRGVLFL